MEEEKKEAQQVTNTLRELLTCPICKEWLSEPLCLKCGHMLCQKCAFDWFAHRPSCPCCRQLHSRRTANTQRVQFDLVRIVDATKAYIDALGDDIIKLK
mmetsp:Transcript_14201/g.18986  ORF Transcript_14201/g.18986 Transcript_14201/m.18986 type:complete len:99 (+) Transcript_14201:159-455(+)